MLVAGSNTGASGNTDDIQPVMSSIARLTAPKLETSATTIRFGVAKYGVPVVVIVESPALKLAMLSIQLPGPKLTRSAPPPKSTKPPKRAPGSTVSVSDSPLAKRIEVPLPPTMVPEFVIVPVPAAIPILSLAMVPELITLTPEADIPATPPAILPELITFAVPPKRP